MNTEASDQELLTETADTLLKHPLAERFIHHCRSTGNNKIYTPDHVLGERLMRLGVLLSCEALKPGALIAMNVEDDKRINALGRFVAEGLRASPHLWTEAVREALSPEVPRLVIAPRLLPDRALWFTFETAITVADSLVYNGKTYNGVAVDALLISDHGDYIQVVEFGAAGDDRTLGSMEFNAEDPPVVSVLRGHIYKHGTIYPDDYQEQPGELVALQSALAFLAFLNSPYIPKTRQRASRSARRECLRRFVEPPDDEVTFVLLRRPVTRKTGDYEDRSVEWKHRWIVSGHIRSQWYPGEQAHRPVWIAPYIKGPEDAPMLTHAYKVAR